MTILILTPHPAGPGNPRRTSVEYYALELARRIRRHHTVRIMCPRGLRGLRRAVRLRPRLIQVENRPRWVTALRRLGYRGPIVLGVHSYHHVAPPRARPRQVRRALRLANLIACPSRAMHRFLEQRFGPAARHVEIIHPGVDLGRFRPPAAPALQLQRRRLRRRWQAGRRPVVLFAGRMVPQKGLHVLIRACATLNPHLPVLLVAAGAPRPGPSARGFPGRLWRLARSTGVPVRFTGQLAHRHMAPAYAAADVVAVPSRGIEAFGLVNVEAMACGTPVVASAAGGIREIIRDGVDGLLIRRARSPRAWAQALQEILLDPALRRRMGHEARSHVAGHFTWDHTARRWLDVYRRFLR